jgi:hypothetical protein
MSLMRLLAKCIFLVAVVVYLANGIKGMPDEEISDDSQESEVPENPENPESPEEDVV